MRPSNEHIRYLFEPRQVAVVGASSHPDKIGYKLMENIVSGGYEGELIPVNPRGGEILGKTVRRSLSDIPHPIDMAILTVPAALVFDSVRECAKIGATHLVIISSGFSEIGNADEEHRITNFAKDAGMRVLGPNIFGVYSARSRFNGTFGPKNITPGKVAIITQSGAIGIAMIGKTAAENIGLSSIVSVGNKSDLDEADLIDYLVRDEATRIILMYIEGVKDGARFIDALRRATAVKPVIVIKSGRSKRGAVAVASHTGSLAGSDEIFGAIMRQCGVLRAESIQEAFNWATFLASAPELPGENSVIVTNGGGIGVLATDACEKHGVKLYDDLSVLKEAFASSVPDFGSLKNPVDLTGQASDVDYDRALQAALVEDRFNSVMALYCETAVLDEQKLARVIENKAEAYRQKKPVVFSLFGGERLKGTSETLRKKGIPVFGEVYEAISALGALGFVQRHRQGREADLAADLAAFESDMDFARAREILAQVRADGRDFLLAPEAQALMRAARIPIPDSAVAKTITQAVEQAERIGYPVVMKVVSRDILHKSDAGGVALGLDNRQEVLEAYEAILHNCRAYNSRAKIDGVEVARMVERRGGVETIIGARRDKTFGPIMMFGLGGIYVEVMKDVSFRSLPISRSEAREMVHEIRAYPLLLGVRGEPPKDMPSLLDTLLKVGLLIQRCEDISDIEVNPLIVYEQGLGSLALDARILISNPREKKQ